MNEKELERLEKLNQLSLTEQEKEQLVSFFAQCQSDADALDTFDTSSVERMVHVMPPYTVIREDVPKKLFTRDQLQEPAPETMDGYWQVPRLVE